MNEIYTYLQIINLILSFLLLTLTTPCTDQPATAAVSPSRVAGRRGRAWPSGARKGGASAHGRAAHGWAARGRAARARGAGQQERAAGVGAWANDGNDELAGASSGATHIFSNNGRDYRGILQCMSSSISLIWMLANP